MESRSARWLAVGLFLALFAAVGVWALGRADHAVRTFDDLRDQPFLLADALLRAHHQIHTLQTSLHDVARTGDTAAARTVQERATPQDQALTEALNLVVTRHGGDDAILAALVHAVSAWRDNRVQVADMVIAGHRDAAVALLDDEGERLYRALHDALETAQAAERRNASRLRAEAETARQTMQWLMLALAVLAGGALVATLGGLVLMVRTHLPLQRLRTTLLALADGDTAVTIPYEDTPSAVGALARAVACFRRSLSERDAALAALRRSEEQLRHAMAEAQAATVAKNRVLAATSHDLRQPLQALRLYLDTLDRRLAGQPGHDLVGGALAALAAGEDLLRNYLDVSLLEAGMVRANVAPVAVAPLLRALADEFAPLAADKGLAVRLVPCEARVLSDPDLLRRMLHNLLTNALRYTPSGRILLGGRRQGGSLRLEIWDTGIGIPADHLKAVFEDFVQLHNPERDRTKGFGLGLSVVERTARLLDHPLAVTSRPGRGSMFAVTVPLAGRAGA